MTTSARTASECPSVRAKTMSVPFRAMIFATMICVCGCPLGTPRDHYRPPGHQDTTIAVSPKDDALLFNAAGAGGRDLYLLDLAHLTVTRIVETADYETAPEFSPDGRRIVYAAGVPGDRADHIFTVGRDGSSRKQLTHIDANDTSPRFSPDGKMIVFARDKTYTWGGLAANWETGGVICLMDADGENLRQLTSDDEFAFEPYFSADGTRVVYSTVNGMRSMPVDGSAGPQLIAGPAGAVPSHDGKLIAYSKGKYSPDLKIFIASSDGTAERVVTPGVRGCSRPVFTHAGDALYFLREEWPDGPTGVPKFGVWKATVDGAEVRRVADLRLFDEPLSWKPQDKP
jgi:Tol biopolymer transport system component